MCWLLNKSHEISLYAPTEDSCIGYELDFSFDDHNGVKLCLIFNNRFKKSLD